MRFKWEMILVGLFLAQGSLLPGQNGEDASRRQPRLHFVNYDIEQGLSHNTVYCIEQDYQGFIWFGTQEGLNRFDGYAFKKYYHINGDSLSLAGNLVNNILEDSKKRLWISTSSGLCIYDREKDHFRDFEDLTGLHLSNNIITSVLQDRTGKYWIGTFNGGVNLYDEEKNVMEVFNNTESNTVLTHHIVRTIFEDRQGIIWIGTHQGLNRYNPESNDFTHFTFQPDEVPGGNDIRSIYETDEGLLWLATNGGGIIEFSKSTCAFHIDGGTSKTNGELTSNTIKSIMQDSKGAVWIGALNGLYLMEPGSDFLHHYQHQPNVTGSLNAHSVRDILEDRDGNIWLALYYGGISFYNPENSRFHNYNEQGPGVNGLSSNIVSAIAEDKAGNLWIGTEGGGLNRFDRKNESFTHFRHNPGEPGISSNFVKSLSFDENGYLWIGTIETGLDRYDPATNTFINFRYETDDPNAIGANYIRSILIDSRKRFWIGTNGGGLLRFYPEKGFFSVVRSGKGENQITGMNINAMVELANGRIAIGTNKGLNLFDPDQMSNSFLSSYDSASNARISEIWCLYADHNNMLWIGTNESGLFRFDIGERHFTQYNAGNLLPNNVVYGILPDGNDNLWISTNKAITKLNLADSSSSHYDNHSGLLSNQFNYNSFSSTSEGELIFGGNKGFTIFDPGEIVENAIPAPARITGFNLMNRPVNLDAPESPLQSNIIVAEEAVLRHYQTVFSIEFAALSYIAPEKNQYEYTLEGFLDEWIYLGNNRSVTFTNLDAGKYTFRLRVSNNDGIWNPEEAQLRITVLPPWWETNAAFIAYFLMISTILFFLVRLYRIRIDEKNKLKYERLEKQRIIDLNQMKLKFFTNISHEFKTPLSLIIGPLEELTERFRKDAVENEASKTIERVHKNSVKLSNLVEQLMTFRKIEAGALKLKVKKVELVAYLRQINESFLEIAQKRHIRFTFTHDLNPVYLWMDPEMMEKVFFNILSNAFKHTPPKGSIQVSVQKHDEHQPVDVIISDNGPGIPPDKRKKIFERFYQIDTNKETESGTGIGLSFAQDIIELHKGSIFVSGEEGKGASFTIQLRQGYEHLQEHYLIHDSDDSPDTVSQALIDENSVPDTQSKGMQQPVKTPEATVLIVEDNESLNEFLATSLSDTYHTLSAYDGMMGLTLTRKHHPDLIIADVMMPEMGGIEMTELLKSDFDTCHIPVIMLTAKSTLDDQISGFRHGADAYITKPFSMKLLRTQVSALLQGRENLKRVFGVNLKIQPSEMKIQSLDDKFMQKAIRIVEDNIDNEKFNVRELGEEIGMSRMQLNRKLKGLLNQTPSEFIRTIRLKRAAQLLVDGKLNVSEVIYYVGISSRTYFTKAFTLQFGMPPTEYLRNYNKEKTPPEQDR